MRHRRAIYAACIGFSLVNAASIAHADATWINGANNLWSNPNNWSPTGMPAPNTLLHIQGPGGVIQQDLGADFQVAGISFEGVTTDIAGQPITLNHGAAVRNNIHGVPQRISAPVNVASAATLGGQTANSFDTIRFDDLRGAGNVTIEGGVTVFGATYTGTTTINSLGRLWIGGRQQGLDFPPPGQTSGQGSYFVDGSLIGRGTIGLASGAAVHINQTGQLSPGVGVTTGRDLSQLAINGRLVVHAGADIAMDTVLSGATIFHDFLIIDGELDLSAADDNLFIGATFEFALAPVQSLVVATYQSRIGEFDLLNNGTNPNYQITYTSPSGGGPGQIIITTPEPGAAIACGFACAALLTRSRVRPTNPSGRG